MKMFRLAPILIILAGCVAVPPDDRITSNMTHHTCIDYSVVAGVLKCSSYQDEPYVLSH